MTRVSIIQIALFLSVFSSFVPALAFASNQQACPDGQRVPDSYIVRFKGDGSEYSEENSPGKTSSLSLSTRLSKSAAAQFSWIYRRGYSEKPDPNNKPGSPAYPSKPTSGSPSFEPASVAVARLSPFEVQSLSQDSEVLSIEPDCKVRLNAVPDDPGASAMWSRSVMNLDGAWDLIHDASSVIVAVSDTGVEYKHEDLAPNMWKNMTELNGEMDVDDDGNGCIDDYYGCDLADQDGDPIPTATSTGAHGTHVAGIIGAFGNNGTGVTGVAWRAKILATKGFSSLDDSASMSDLLRTVYYSVNQGARVINCSWGIAHSPTQAEIEAFQYALSKGALPVIAAGNESTDASMMSPASIPGVLTVGSVNSQFAMSAFSNFGSVVSVFAPGGDALSKGGPVDEYIYSTVPDMRGSYAKMRGTSMAAPHVSGLAALMLAANSALSPSDLIRIIKNTSRLVRTSTPTGIKTDILVPDAQAAVLAALSEKAMQPRPTPAPKSSESASDCSASGTCSTELPSVSEPIPSVTAAGPSAGGCGMTTRQISSTLGREPYGVGAVFGFGLLDPGSMMGALLFALPGVLSVFLRKKD